MTGNHNADALPLLLIHGRPGAKGHAGQRCGDPPGARA
jgi:hypothetical protein